MNLATPASANMKLTHQCAFAIAMETFCGLRPKRALGESSVARAPMLRLKPLISLRPMWIGHAAAPLLLHPPNLNRDQADPVTARDLNFSMRRPEGAPFWTIPSIRSATG